MSVTIKVHTFGNVMKTKIISRDVHRNFERGFHYSEVTVILEYFVLPDCFIRLYLSFHQNHNSEQCYKCCYHVGNYYLAKIKV